MSLGNYTKIFVYVKMHKYIIGCLCIILLMITYVLANANATATATVITNKNENVITNTCVRPLYQTQKSKCYDCEYQESSSSLEIMPSFPSCNSGSCPRATSGFAKMSVGA